MGATLGFTLKEDGLDAHQTSAIELIWEITGAKAGRLIFRQGNPKYIAAFDTGTTQAQIDATLETTNEFLATTMFDATSLGANCMSFVVNCAGQIQDVYAIQTVLRSGGSIVEQANVKQTSAPAAVAPTIAQPQVFIGSQGNLGIKIFNTGIDAFTTGVMIIRLYAILK